MQDTETIKERLPIDQLIGSYLPLKRAGRIYKALCPFHQEKTPSFTVNPERGIFKCFGCGEGGDIFDFVMKLEGLSFPEALELLADKAGVTLTKRETGSRDGYPQHQPSGPSKVRLFALNQHVARIWHQVLVKHAKAEDAREYLLGRGLKEETWKQFLIGYAPYGQGTSEGLRQAGYSQEEQRAAGDPARMQDRIIFPITDITGRVLGFTGRLLEHPEDPRSPRLNQAADTSRGPKYWNTPETPLFQKSKAVFALHLAKQAIQKEDMAIMAEGQMDVVMLHQFGFTNAVASSGTALTQQQLRTIARFSDRIAFAYDQDKAGIEATKRGIELALQEEMTPYVIQIPKGKDPAECLQKEPEAWTKAYTNRLPYMQWLLNQTLKEVKPDGGACSPIEKKSVVKALLPWLLRVTDPVEQAEWMRIVAGRLLVEMPVLQSALERARKPSQTKPTTALTPIANPTTNLTPLQKHAELAAALVIGFPALLTLAPDQLPELRHSASTPYLTEVLALLEKPHRSNDVTPVDLLEEISDPEKRKTIALYTEELLRANTKEDQSVGESVDQFLELISRIKSERREAQKAVLAGAIQAAQQDNDREKLKALFRELQNLV
jgi:DNA primase